MKDIRYVHPHISSYSLSSEDFARLGVEDHEPMTFGYDAVTVNNEIGEVLLNAGLGFTEQTEPIEEDDAEAKAAADAAAEQAAIEAGQGDVTSTGAAATGVSTATAKSRASGRNG